MIPADAQAWKDIPLFVRGGSIVATQPVEQYVGQHPVTEITLDIFPAKSAAEFTAYDDDGETYNYEKGRDLRQAITAQTKGKRTEITIYSASGSYASPLLSYLVRIHTAARRVRLNGKKLPEVVPTALSSAPGVNWSATSDRFGSVVLLQVAAGARTPFVVELK